jgi:hypothetical protein
MRFGRISHRLDQVGLWFWMKGGQKLSEFSTKRIREVMLSVAKAERIGLFNKRIVECVSSYLLKYSIVRQLNCGGLI